MAYKPLTKPDKDLLDRCCKQSFLTASFLALNCSVWMHTRYSRPIYTAITKASCVLTNDCFKTHNFRVKFPEKPCLLTTSIKNY